MSGAAATDSFPTVLSGIGAMKWPFIDNQGDEL